MRDFARSLARTSLNVTKIVAYLYKPNFDRCNYARAPIRVDYLIPLTFSLNLQKKKL